MIDLFLSPFISDKYKCDNISDHGLRTPREEIAFTARPKTHSHSQIFRYGQSIFCLPHRPKFSDFFDLCLHWVSVVRGVGNCETHSMLLRKLHMCSILSRDNTKLHTSLQSLCKGYIFIVGY